MEPTGVRDQAERAERFPDRKVLVDVSGGIITITLKSARRPQRP